LTFASYNVSLDSWRRSTGCWGYQTEGKEQPPESGDITENKGGYLFYAGPLLTPMSLKMLGLAHSARKHAHAVEKSEGPAIFMKIKGEKTAFWMVRRYL
jgi:hypothetical protein